MFDWIRRRRGARHTPDHAERRRTMPAAWLESVWQDARGALRTFRHRPIVWAVAALSLALGIGANTAAFSIVDHLLFRRLPVPAADGIVLITSPGPRPGSRSTGADGGVEAVFSYPLVRDLERLEGTGLTLAAHGSFGANLAAPGHAATNGDGLLVSGRYFPLLGLRPVLGRLLGPEDDRVPGAHPVVVLSHAYWSGLGSPAGVVGTSMAVNGQPMAIVGVAPRGFTGLQLTGQPDVFVPLAMAEAMRPGWSGTDARADHWLYLVGRLDPGLRRAEAERRLSLPFSALLRDVEFPIVQSQMADRFHAEFLARRIVLEPGAYGRSASRGEQRTVLLLLLAVTGLVLLIACANVANLLLARAADRTADIALRLSLGASRGRLVRGLLTEACLLGVIGTAGALVVARLALDTLVALAPADAGATLDIALSAPVWLAAMALGLGTSLLFGLFPALHGVRMAVADGLRAQSARASGSRAVVRVRATLASVQTALATTLLALAGLTLVSLVNLTRVDVGFDANGLVAFGISPPLSGYAPDRTIGLVDSLEEQLRALPGVRSVSTATIPVVAGWNASQNLTVEGFDAAAGTDSQANRSVIGPDYFRTLGIPLLAGRELSRADTTGAPRVALVNEAFARKFRLAEPVVGRRFAFGQRAGATLDIEIVGLVRDAAYSNVRQAPPPQFFLPHRQAEPRASTYFFYVRGAGDPRPLLDAIPTLVHRLAPAVPVVGLRTVGDQIARQMAGDRLAATFTSVFAALATLLAGIGLYAVLAYAVARRRREIGVRIALGATAGTIRRSVLAQVSRIVITGLVLGVAGAVALGRAGSAFLVGLDGSDPRVLAGAAGVVMLVALAAAIIPARRAVSVNPVEAIRAE